MTEVGLEPATVEMAKATDRMRKAFVALSKLKSADEVDEFRNAIQWASKVAKLMNQTEQIRHDFVFLEIACLRKLVELGAKDRIPRNVRGVLPMTEGEIERLIIEWPIAFSVGSLMAFRRHHKHTERIEFDFKKVTDQFPNLAEWARIASETDEPFTIEAFVVEINSSLPAPITGNALKTVKTALQTELTRVEDATVFDMTGLPPFISYQSPSNEWFHVPIANATLAQLDMVIQGKREQLENYKGRLSKLEALRAMVIKDGRLPNQRLES